MRTASRMCCRNRFIVFPPVPYGVEDDDSEREVFQVVLKLEASIKSQKSVKMALR